MQTISDAFDVETGKLRHDFFIKTFVQVMKMMRYLVTVNPDKVAEGLPAVQAYVDNHKGEMSLRQRDQLLQMIKKNSGAFDYPTCREYIKNIQFFLRQVGWTFETHPPLLPNDQWTEALLRFFLKEIQDPSSKVSNSQWQTLLPALDEVKQKDTSPLVPVFACNLIEEILKKDE